MRPFDQAAFLRVRDEVLSREREQKGIGTLGEKSLHAVLKAYYEPFGALHEQKLGRYVADILNEEGVTEIQTQGLSKMRDKLRAFTAVTHVTVIHPVVRNKWLSWVDPETGETSPKRKSPKRGTLYDAFWELMFLRELLPDENLTICLVLLDMEETRYLNGWSRDKKRGSSRMDRFPTALVSETVLNTREDWFVFVPEELPETFTRKEFAAAAGIRAECAGWCIAVLEAVGVLVHDGKRGREYLYRRQNARDEGQSAR